MASSSSSSSGSGDASSSASSERRDKKEKKEKKAKRAKKAKKARKEKKEKKRKREKKASKRRSKKARASRDGDVSDRELSESSGGGGARESSARRDDDDPANPPPPVGVASVASDAFLAAARRVEAARSAALEEDALLERAGAPPANLLSFRSQGLDGGFDPDASNLGGRAHLSAAARRAASERLDELVPKATGREAMLERRAAVRQSNREMATAKEDAVFDGSFGGFGAAAAMGGGDDFAVALAASRAAKARRDARRGVDREALERRAEAHRAREEARVREFRALLKTDEG